MIATVVIALRHVDNFMMGIIKIESLSKFDDYNKILLSIVTTL